MSAERHIAVIDIGKTNAKLALVDGATLAEIAVLSCPNRVRPGPPYPHFDLQALWGFVTAGLAQLQASHGIEAISITTHGAAAVLLDARGDLAAPMLDYEHDGPEASAAAYAALRPDFAQTGSPRLGLGLNLGAQLHWLFARDAGLLARTAHIVTYPQYWGYRLTGELACDVTSLGCHTDLWNPHEARLSDLPARLGIAGKLAPIRAPGDVLGRLRPELAARLGLSRDVPVYTGIHDSNASLLPHVLAMDPPFGVVSSGTWVIAMAMGGGAGAALDAGRDTLINVNARGAPVPSARFMGGREYAILTEGQVQGPPGPQDMTRVLQRQIMLLPAAVPSAGPFQGQAMRWHPAAPAQGNPDYLAAVAIYLALMTDTCLGLIGQEGPIIVEGPFAANLPYLQMLRALTGRRVLRAASQTGTSAGAALLALPGAVPGPSPQPDEVKLRPRPQTQFLQRNWDGALKGSVAEFSKTPLAEASDYGEEARIPYPALCEISPPDWPGIAAYAAIWRKLSHPAGQGG